MDQTFNGYTNIDTWRVLLWINNHKPAYDILISLTPDDIIGIKDLRHLKNIFKINNRLPWSFGYTYETVAWDQVNLEEIKEDLKNYLMEAFE